MQNQRMSLASVIPFDSDAALQLVPETRGYFMNLVRSMTPEWLEFEVRRAAAAGFNLLIFPVYSNGWTLFPSQGARKFGMPSINPLFRKWDPLAAVCEIAEAEGMKVWGFARPYNFHPRYSIADHKLLKKFPEWRARAHPRHNTTDTRRQELWNPCPVNTDYRRFVGDVLTEMATSYPVDGLVLNFTQFILEGGSLENSPFCFCHACREQYAREHAGSDLVEHAQADRLPMVRTWQLAQAHDHLLYLRHRLTQAHRTLRLICRVRPAWREAPGFNHPLTDGPVLINWPEALEAGVIESLAIDNDGEPLGETAGSRIAADYAYLGDRVLFMPIVPIKQIEDLSAAFDAVQRMPVPGMIAEFHVTMDDRQAAEIRRRFFPRGAFVPESDPIRTAIYLLDNVRMRHANHAVLSDLLRDVLRLLMQQIPVPNDFKLLQVIEQNMSGLEQFIRRGRLGKNDIPEVTLRELGLARRYVRLASMDVSD